MDSHFLEEIGKHIYGENWKKPLAQAVGLSDRQIARYVNENHPFSGVLRDGRNLATILYDLLVSHEKGTIRLMTRVRRLTPKTGKDSRRDSGT